MSSVPRGRSQLRAELSWRGTRARGVSSTRRRIEAAALAWALAFCATGCPSTDRDAARAEAGRLSHAIEQLRDAHNEDKRAPLAALERISCSADDRCKMQKTCLDAYRMHIEALDQLALARQSLEHSDAPMTEQATALIAAAQQGLTRAKDAAKRCADLQGDAVRRYHL